MSDEAFRPLNPRLYKRLEVVFNGHVRVAHEGEEMIYRLRSGSEYGIDIIASGEYYRVCCFAPETMVATPAGDKPIASLVGMSDLLVPNAKGLGAWKQMEVRSFGRQKLLTVHLRRRRTRKTIRATPDHRWITLPGREYVKKTTAELQAGDKLASTYARTLDSYGAHHPRPSPMGVAQGFVFGDGTCEAEGRKPAYVDIYSTKDHALLPYFAACRLTVNAGVPCVQDLPRFWKELPPADESLSFLLGWLSGYFAADGTVSKSGTQAVLYSASEANLNFAKGICYQLGVRVSPVRPKQRSSDGCVAGAADLPMFEMSFPAADMPTEFWLIDLHRRRAARGTRSQKSHWVVERVVDNGDVDDVYCAVVPGIEKFSLADNILTMNCPFCNDTRFRLWINHRYGTVMPCQEKKTWTWVVHCYNERCMDEYDNRTALFERVCGTLTHHERSRYQLTRPSGAAKSRSLTHISPPGLILPLNQLDVRDPAREFMESDRGFNADYLTDCYQIGYCTESEEWPTMTGRIYIPIHMNDMLVGWQGRYVGNNANWKFLPKYYGRPGMPKSLMLYNWDAARQGRLLYIVEGAPATWAMPDWHTVALLGKSLTSRQLQLLRDWARQETGAIVLILDPDAQDGIDSTIADLMRITDGRFANILLPEGQDPADIETDYLYHGIIQRQTAAAGLNLWDYSTDPFCLGVQDA